MKQVIQDIRSGKTMLEEVPAPTVRKGHLLIQSRYSLVSLGTEKMLLDFGKANLIDKARQQPDKVKMVLEKVKSDGLIPTVETVVNKLNQPIPLGYCNVGKVVEVGEGVSGFKVGDRVVSNGHHAEFVCTPENLVARIPDGVTDQEATFTVISAIGLQGIRLLNPTFGETVVVIGLGLIGLVTAELLKSNGCHVIGFDFDKTKVDLALSKGIEAYCNASGFDTVNCVMTSTNQVGADGIIITASTKSNDVISQAAKMSRKRGRIILVGVIGLDLSRADFYEKELTFQVSCSYGPGRYDDTYEQQGRDYPLPYVRWTEKRNFQAVLGAIKSGGLDVKPLISKVVPLSSYYEVYDQMGKDSSIACLLEYDSSKKHESTVRIGSEYQLAYEMDHTSIGLIGSGNFTSAVVLPALKKNHAKIKYIASANGLSSALLAKKFNILNATSDYKQIMEDGSVGLVGILTRHNLHAKLVIEALKANKHVYVEKPLALNKRELEEILKVQSESKKSITVGYNRRFSSHIVKVKEIINDSPDLNIVATMNAGFIPSESWLHGEEGGGRIIGEACHLFDLLIYLTGSRITMVCMNALGDQPKLNTDNASILLKFANGANATVNYFSNGSKSYSKERLEVYSQGKSVIMDNYRSTIGFGVKGFKKMTTRQDKGHHTQFRMLADFVSKGGPSLIPIDEIVNSTKATFSSLVSLQEKKWVQVD